MNRGNKGRELGFLFECGDCVELWGEKNRSEKGQK